MTQKEEVDSKEIKKFSKGQRFTIEKFGSSDIRVCVSTFSEKDGVKGWISVESRKGVPLVGPVTDAKGGEAVMDKHAFCKMAKPGDYGETAFHVTVRREESMSSNILYELGVGVPFKLLERAGEGESRRCKVQLFTKNNRTGWISFETRKQEPLVGPISRKNREALVDSAEVIKEYESGQTHEVKTALRVEDDEDEEACLTHFYLQPGEKVTIIEISEKNKARAKIRVLNAKSTGWIRLIQAGGDPTIGKIGTKTQTGWKSSKVKNFLFAARDGDLARLKEICEGGSFMSSAPPINCVDAQGKTALIYAAAFGRPECVVYLLTRPNVEVNAIDTFNRTPLHHACKIGHARIVDVLLKSGANANARDLKGHVPLMQLAVIGELHPDAYKCVPILFRHHAIPTILDYNGVGSVDFASSVKDEKMMKLLIDGGAGPAKVVKPTEKSTDSPTKEKESKDAQNIKKKAKEAAKELIHVKEDKWEGESEDEEVASPAAGESTRAELTPKETAQSELDKAMESSDIMNLTNAIEGALALGLDVKDAEKRRKELNDRHKAEEWMENCLNLDDSGNTIEKMKEALANCKKAKMPENEIVLYQKKIDKAIPILESRKALEKASKIENIGSLEGEIKKASDILSKKELEPYITLLDEYKNFDAAMDTLNELYKKQDIEALQEKVKMMSQHVPRMKPDQKKLLKDAEDLVAKEMPKLDARKKVQAALDCNPDSADYIKNLDAVGQEVLKLGIINNDEVLKRALRIVQAEKEKIRIRSEIKEIMEATKTFSKLDDVEQLESMKKKLQKLVDESRSDKVMLPELETAPVALRQRKVHNRIEDLKGAIRIYFRARPLSQNEKDQGGVDALSYGNDGMTIHVTDEEANLHKYELDNCFTPGTQEEVFVEVKELIQSVYDGYNVTLFAYGQTGAGKTYTMYGAPGNDGVVPRSLREIFNLKKDVETSNTVTVMGQMIELYRSEFNDLLSTVDVKARPVLTVRTDKKGAVYLENATQEQANSAEDLENMIQKGFEGRKVSATLMNSESSRSHLIVVIQIVVSNNETGETLRGKLILVDLAGSERMKKSGVQGEQMKEAIEINKSLTALGDVIEQLTSGQKTIGYRNHKLTQIMQDAIGGSAKTLMFCNCSPATINVDETIMTLKWASRAKQVRNAGAGAAHPKVKAKPKARTG